MVMRKFISGDEKKTNKTKILSNITIVTRSLVYDRWFVITCFTILDRLNKFASKKKK